MPSERARGHERKPSRRRRRAPDAAGAQRQSRGRAAADLDAWRPRANLRRACRRSYPRASPPPAVQLVPPRAPTCPQGVARPPAVTLARNPCRPGRDLLAASGSRPMQAHAVSGGRASSPRNSTSCRSSTPNCSTRAPARLGHERDRVGGRGTVGVLDEVRVLRRDLRAADPVPLQPAGLEHPPGAQLVIGVLEDASERPPVRRLRRLPLRVQLPHLGPDLLRRTRAQPQLGLAPPPARAGARSGGTRARAPPA